MNSVGNSYNLNLMSSRIPFRIIHDNWGCDSTAVCEESRLFIIYLTPSYAIDIHFGVYERLKRLELAVTFLHVSVDMEKI